MNTIASSPIAIPVPGREYAMTVKRKAQPWSAGQPRTAVEDGAAFETTMIRVTGVEERRDARGRRFFYVSHRPAREHAGAYRFGCSRVYPDAAPEYGVKEFRPLP